MKSNVRILDKSKRCNRRCGSCKHWKRYKIGKFYLRSPMTYYCSNCNSTKYLKDRYYWNCCKGFEWADNIKDRNERN